MAPMRLLPSHALRFGAATLLLASLTSCASATQQTAAPAAPPPAAAPATPAAAPTTGSAPPSPTPTPAPSTASQPAAKSTPTGKPGGSAKSAQPGGASASGKPTEQPAAPSAPVAQPAPGAKVDCSQLKCIALTFDDGPGKDTPTLLRTLTDEQVVATFFMQGVNVKANQQTVRQVADTPGMEIGNHTTSHANLPGAGKDKLNREITRNDALLEQTTGRKVTLFRPPYGAHNASVDSVAAASGEAVVLWDVDTLDWKTKSTSATRDAVRKQAKPGSIVLMHDIHSTTVNAVPDIVRDLKAQGYTLVTVSQLLGDTAPGKVYIRR